MDDDIISVNDTRFYLVKIGDLDGSTARGPYTENEALALLESGEHMISSTRLERMRNPQPVTKIEKKREAPVLSIEGMEKDIRQWGWTLLVLGVIHIIGSGFLDASWGIILILVGLLSFLYRTSSMYVIYGITLAWVAITNMLGGKVSWFVFALLQAFLSVKVFQSYFRYRRAESQAVEGEGGQPAVQRKMPAELVFPWAGCVIGTLSLVAFFGSMAVIFLVVALGRTVDEKTILNFSLSFSMELGVLGFALGLASLLSRYRYKAVSIGGMVTGILSVLIMIVMAILG